MGLGLRVPDVGHERVHCVVHYCQLHGLRDSSQYHQHLDLTLVVSLVQAVLERQLGGLQGPGLPHNGKRLVGVPDLVAAEVQPHQGLGVVRSLVGAQGHLVVSPHFHGLGKDLVERWRHDLRHEGLGAVKLLGPHKEGGGLLHIAADVMHLRGLDQVTGFLQNYGKVLEHVHLPLVGALIACHGGPLLLLGQLQRNLHPGLHVPKMDDAPSDPALAHFDLIKNLLRRSFLGTVLLRHPTRPPKSSWIVMVEVRVEFCVNGVLEILVTESKGAPEVVVPCFREAGVVKADGNVVGPPRRLVLPPELQGPGVLPVNIRLLQVAGGGGVRELKGALPPLEVHVHLQSGLGIAGPEKVGLCDFHHAPVGFVEGLAQNQQRVARQEVLVLHVPQAGEGGGFARVPGHSVPEDGQIDSQSVQGLRSKGDPHAVILGKHGNLLGLLHVIQGKVLVKLVPNVAVVLVGAGGDHHRCGLLRPLHLVQAVLCHDVLVSVQQNPLQVD